jgi:hypothetical protein
MAGLLQRVIEIGLDKAVVAKTKLALSTVASISGQRWVALCRRGGGVDGGGSFVARWMAGGWWLVARRAWRHHPQENDNKGKVFLS